MGFFNNSETGAIGTEEAQSLEKALSAGYGTDSASLTGGRALIPENLESETINVVSALKEDCKIMNSVKKTPVKSTVHEVNLRTDHGEYRFASIAEGGNALETNQSVERKPFNMKYLATKRSVTMQMEVSETFEGALASEKLSGVETIIKAAEFQCFHGNSKVVPTEFDGFLASIKGADAKERNIVDLRGKTIGSYGEKIFDEIAGTVFDKGGYLDKALYPTVLAKDIKELFEAKQRYIMNQPLPNLSFKSIPDYGTAVGANIALSGENAGADKFYHVKGEVTAAGDASKRPSAPASVTAVAASDSSSKFASSDAGDYKYTVHAVNQYGISAGTEVAAAVTVASGEKVTLTITPSSTGAAATGYIICRSAKDGTTVMEMDSVGDSGKATTVYEDLNTELPGTASMLLLTEKRIQPVYNFAQLMPVCTVPLAKTTLETPFMVAMFGGLEVLVPKFMGLVNNIAYKGGLY